MSIVAKKIMMGSGAVALPSDDQFNRVSFLSHFDGANNGVNNAFDDGSASNHTITANGNVTQGSFGPFARPDGEWGVTMPTGPIIQNNYAGSVEVASHSDFTLSGQYTIEFFVNSTTLKNPGGASNIGLFAVGPENNANSMNLFFAGTTVRYWTSTAYNTFGSSSDIVTNSWIHVAVCRNSSNVITCFINGTALGTTFSDTTTPQGQVVIGAELYQTARYNSLVGSISNFRILNGTCLYTSNFTAPTSELTAITNTKLLTCQSNRLVDNSASGHTVTVTGAPAVSAFGPFLTSEIYSAATNGASSIGGYVSAATSTDWQFGSGNFTVEFWTYPLGTGNWVIAHGDGSIAGTSISWQYGHGTFDFYYGTSYVQITSPTLTLYNWQHIAVVRNGATITVYKNGTSTGTANIGSNTLNTGGTTPFYVGNYPNAGSGNINGYLSDVRVVKGTAVYTSNFTPPTAPLTAITNTKLLLNMADGQAIDSAAQNNLTLYGTAKLSTGQAKFGDTSLLLDGNSDYAIFPNGATGGAGDWTIEMFIFPANVGSGEFGTLLDNRPDSTNGAYQTLVLAAATLKIYVGGSGASYRITSDDSLSANTWYHVAVCKSGSSTKMFIDGTQTGSTFTDNVTYINTGRTLIGAEVTFGSGIDEFFNGYIDEIRLSNMARYTSNFTAPTKPFPDKGQ